MKLKKIASLALAGVMAVSMLAGCSVKVPGTNNGTTDEGETTTVSSVSTELRSALDDAAMRKVTAVSNSALDKALKEAVDKYFTNENYNDATNFTAKEVTTGKIYKTVADEMKANTDLSQVGQNDKTVATEVYVVNYSVSDAAALEQIADQIKGSIAGLADKGNKEDYKYEISASIVTCTREVSNTTVGVKYIAVAVAQNATSIV